MTPYGSDSVIYCFDLMHRGVRCGTSWARFTGVDNEGQFVQCRQEIFDTPELGLSKSRRQSEYAFDSDGVLTSAKLWDQNGNHVAYAFTPEQMRVGGQSRRLNKPLTFVVEQNMMAFSVAQLESSLRASRHISDAFVPESGNILPYEVSMLDGQMCTNLGEIFVWDASGHVEKVRLETSDFEFEKSSHPFPRWSLTGVKSRCTYTPPGHVHVEDVDVPIGDPTGLVRSGTVARPASNAKEFAAAIFIGGTGVYNRHGYTTTIDIGYHQLLDDFASEGVSSLRYERFDPNAANLKEAEGGLGFEDICDHAEQALDWLAEQPWALSLPKIIIGHSLGGLVALELSTRRDDLDAIVLLSVPGRTFREVVQEQQGWFLQNGQNSTETTREIEALNQAIVTALERDEAWTKETVDARILALGRKRKLYGEILDIDPAKLVSKGTCPIILVQGTADVQVGVKDAQRIGRAAQKSRRLHRVHVEKDLDHLLKRNRERGLKALKLYSDRRRRIPIRLIRQIVRSLNGFIKATS